VRSRSASRTRSLRVLLPHCDPIDMVVEGYHDDASFKSTKRQIDDAPDEKK